MAGNLKYLDSGNFNETIGQDKPVLVDFSASWCGPCRIVGPIIEELADSYADGRAVVAKLDVDEESEIAMRYGVRSVPTIILFKAGAEIGRLVGVRSSTDYVSLIDRNI